jgi:hypothetical protein
MTRPSLARMAVALLLVISAVAFIIGVSRERSAEGKTGTHQDAAPTAAIGAAAPTPTHNEAGETTETHSEEGETSEEGEAHNETAPTPTHNEAAEGAETHNEEGEEAPATSTGESAGAQSEVAPTPTHDEAAEGAGGHDETGEAAGAHTEENRDILGIDPESTGAVTAAVALSLLLALAVWLRGTSLILGVAVAFGLLFAALDIREPFHQGDESRDGLVALALLIAALHVGVAIAAGVALKERQAASSPFAQG